MKPFLFIIGLILNLALINCTAEDSKNETEPNGVNSEQGNSGAGSSSSSAQNQQADTQTVTSDSANSSTSDASGNKSSPTHTQKPGVSTGASGDQFGGSGVNTVSSTPQSNSRKSGSASTSTTSK